METPRRRGIGSLLLAVLGALSGLVPLAAQEPTVTLGGRVIDARGEPLPAAKVWVTEIDDTGHVLARGFTDADGVFRVPRVPMRDTWEVFAIGDGWSVTRATASSAAAPVLLCAQPALRLGGTLRRADGSPVVGVEVRGVAFALRPPIDEFAVTDAEGRWRLDHLRVGPCSIVAAVPGEGLFACNGLLLDDADDVELLGGGGAGRSLTVQLRGMPPEAAGKVFVELAPENGFPGLPRPWLHAALDAAGEVTLTELPNVAYRVTLRSRDVLLVRPSFEIPPDAKPRTVVFEVQPDKHTTRTMRVRLRDPAGQPVCGVRLRLGAVAPTVARPALATTDQDGLAEFACCIANDTSCAIWSEDQEFVVLGAPAGGAYAAGENWMRHTCLARDGLEVEVLAAPAVRVCGRVLDTDGAPIAGQVVGLGVAGYQQGVGPPLATSVSGADGTFVMPMRAVGDGDQEFVVTVGAVEVACESRLFALSAAPRRCDLGDLRLPATGRLEVRVTAANGSVVRGAIVHVMRPLANGGWQPFLSQLSDADGRVCFPALRPGDRQVSHRPRGGQGGWAMRSCVVEAGVTHEVQLTTSQ